MKHDYIVRHVRGYGYLPIVRDWNEEKEVARGEFRAGPLEALEAAIEMGKGAEVALGLDIIRDHMKETA